MNQEKIGKFIKDLRIKNNLTQQELASKLGVTYQAVSKWETGKNIPDISVMKQISEYFNINIDEILNGQKYKSKNIAIKYIIGFLSLILVILLIIFLINKNEDFTFKTISSECSRFTISGSMAYNKDKSSIYISNIEYCGGDDAEDYKKVECFLYEQDGKTKKEISACDTKENTTLESFLKDVKFSVDNYSNSCKYYKDNSLYIEIEATNKEDKTITYNIPLKLNDNCLE